MFDLFAIPVVRYEDCLGDDQCMEASDACGRMVSLAEAGVWSCEYQLDSSGRYPGVAEQCEGRRVAKTWEYDAFGRMSRYVTKDDRNGETTCSWNYDVCGNLVSEAAQKNGAKEERIYEYDDCDRLVRLKRKNGSGESVTDFQWNADGELLGVVGRGSERTGGRIPGTVAVGWEELFSKPRESLVKSVMSMV